MTLWEMDACVAGWKIANNVKDKPEPPSASEFYDMVARLGG